MKSVIIPDSVTSIGSNAFAGCKGLTSINIPSSIKRIETSTFDNCINLESIIIPDSVTAIDSQAFAFCQQLSSITIPDSVTSIGDGAFASCIGLTNIHIGKGIKNIVFGTFAGCTGLTSIIIPDSVTLIGELAFSGCINLTSITIPDSVKYISRDTYSDAFYECNNFTIYGTKESYAEIYATEKNIPFVELKQLVNNSILSAETIKLGETVTATAKATGGTGEYLYQVVYKQTTQSKWTTAQSYKANATVTFKPASAATYDVCVKVKDSNNTEVKKFFTVTVTSDALKNISTISAETINLGSTVTVNAKATGSTGFYTYAVYYKQKAQTKWTTKQDFKANNTVAVKPAKATTYDICVKVKDDKGTIVKKYFKVNVTDFVNTSTLSATEIKLGNTVKVSCSATGSTGFYQYAVYYKKTSDTKWTTKQTFSSNNTVTIKPAKATTYDVCVKVKDNQDNVIKKYFSVTVK